MGEKSGLEDKITRIACATFSSVVCVYGGFTLGWSRAQGVPLEYETLITYGPILLSAGMFGAYSGVEGYSQAVEEPLLLDPLSFTAKMAVGGAAMGGFLGGYNQLCFYVIGYVAGMVK